LRWPLIKDPRCSDHGSAGDVEFIVVCNLGFVQLWPYRVVRLRNRQGHQHMCQPTRDASRRAADPSAIPCPRFPVLGMAAMRKYTVRGGGCEDQDHFFLPPLLAVLQLRPVACIQLVLRRLNLQLQGVASQTAVPSSEHLHSWAPLLLSSSRPLPGTTAQLPLQHPDPPLSWSLS
ncbi:unnamed protein product, partial [Symbiodinium microadriaticum]